ncbi:MAG TPA: tyrosine-type recombinase/integrase [Polyangiaceae bacterium]|nr:tyrosine-type recombinase/integrase [Polyangiaceae bacterium]
MKTLAKLLAEYLDLRRKLGFKAERETWLLTKFVSFLRAEQSSFITIDLALAWAKQPADAHPSWWASKLSVVRGFAQHAHLIDARHQVPPRDLLPRHSRRTTPSIYSSEEIARLLRAARQMPSRITKGRPFRSLTYETLFGLVAATGMRIGEAIRLDDSDVDWSNQLLCVRESKFGKSREVVLHESVLRALLRYSKQRDQVHPHPCSSSFFVSLTGTRLIYNNVHLTFARLLRLADIHRRKARVHDLRHTFIVRTILQWHQQGVDVDSRMPALSTYVGHRDPSSTYWYVSATPELMALVARKVQRALGVLP